MLVSALNVLNEAEINYMPARNKRLHVELALIKLCYLQQALDLTKKKSVDAPIAFRKVGIRPFVPVKQEAKLSIDTRLIEEKKKPSTEPRQEAPIQTAANTKLTALDKIRKNVKKTSQSATGVAEQSPLNAELLQLAWNDYVSILREQKNPAAQNLEMAELKIQDENSFTALVTNNIQFKFIEQEGLKVSQFLRERLKNPNIQFFIVMEQNKETRQVAAESLTAKEQYQKLVEKYPLIKELKDKLRLELDY